MRKNERWKSVVTYSPKAAAYWKKMRQTYDEFGCDVPELEHAMVDGPDRAYEVFDVLSYCKVCTFFWTGNHYLIFPVSENELMKRLRAEKKRQNTWFPEEPATPVILDLTRPENAKYIVERY